MLNQDDQNNDEVAIESGKNKNNSELNSNANQNTFWFKSYRLLFNCFFEYGNSMQNNNLFYFV